MLVMVLNVISSPGYSRESGGLLSPETSRRFAGENIEHRIHADGLNHCVSGARYEGPKLNGVLPIVTVFDNISQVYMMMMMSSKS